MEVEKLNVPRLNNVTRFKLNLGHSCSVSHVIIEITTSRIGTLTFPYFTKGTSYEVSRDD